MTRELLFSVTRDDFDESHIRGTGAGGQKKNKTHSGVRLVHRESGAVGESTESREQHRNRMLAFRKAIATPEFQRWFAEKCAVLQGMPSLTDRVNAALQPENITTQVLVNNKWVTVDWDSITE